MKVKAGAYSVSLFWLFLTVRFPLAIDAGASSSDASSSTKSRSERGDRDRLVPDCVAEMVVAKADHYFNKSVE